MKTLGSKLGVLAGAVVLGFLLAGQIVRAADQKAGQGGSGKPPPDAETLRRYDRNGNGKLDPDEEAAMKADRERAKNNEKKKKS